jgi:hypothetical protein
MRSYERVGALAPHVPTEEERETRQAVAEGVQTGITGALRQVTPALIVGAIVTGGCFAIGNYLARRYVLRVEK